MLASSSPMSSHNTTSTTNSFQLTYQDKGTFGLVISYPFDWKRIVADDKALIFLPPSKHDKFSESLVVALFHINGSISAGQLSGKAINKYGQHYNEFPILHSKPFIFDSDPEWILLYSYTNPVAGKIFAMDIRINDGNKVYIISYSAEQPEYDTYLATIEKMINSFRMTQVDGSVTN
jgi:eukaryotic-like serine/threonine-protein kinase